MRFEKEKGVMILAAGICLLCLLIAQPVGAKTLSMEAARKATLAKARQSRRAGTVTDILGRSRKEVYRPRRDTVLDSMGDWLATLGRTRADKQKMIAERRYRRNIEHLRKHGRVISGSSVGAGEARL